MAATPMNSSRQARMPTMPKVRWDDEVPAPPAKSSLSPDEDSESPEESCCLRWLIWGFFSANPLHPTATKCESSDALSLGSATTLLTHASLSNTKRSTAPNAAARSPSRADDLIAPHRRRNHRSTGAPATRERPRGASGAGDQRRRPFRKRRGESLTTGVLRTSGRLELTNLTCHWLRNPGPSRRS
eukprot:scaffold1272_cov250-Pinguiococcus_pyrenoidosus.AAC.65